MDHSKILLLFNVKFKFTNKQCKQYPMSHDIKATGFKNKSTFSFLVEKVIIRQLFLYIQYK